MEQDKLLNALKRRDRGLVMLPVDDLVRIYPEDAERIIGRTQVSRRRVNRVLEQFGEKEFTLTEFEETLNDTWNTTFSNAYCRKMLDRMVGGRELVRVKDGVFRRANRQEVFDFYIGGTKIESIS